MKTFKKILSFFIAFPLVSASCNFFRVEAKNPIIQETLSKEKILIINPQGRVDYIKVEIIKILKYCKKYFSNKWKNPALHFGLYYNIKRSIHNFKDALCTAFKCMERRDYANAHSFMGIAYRDLKDTIMYQKELNNLESINSDLDNISNLILSRLSHCLHMTVNCYFHIEDAMNNSL